MHPRHHPVAGTHMPPPTTSPPSHHQRGSRSAVNYYAIEYFFSYRGNPMRHALSMSLFLLISSSATWAETFTINSSFTPPTSTVFRLILEDAFNRIGLEVDFREISAERSIDLVNDGTDDGECCRIGEINEFYPHLVRVPVPVIRVDFVAFTRDPDIPLTDWDSLAAYDVGIVSGWKILEREFTLHPPRQLYILDSSESMFGMLDKGRIQVAVIGRLVGYQKIRTLGLHNIKAIDPPLASRPMYLFLHEKHRGRIAEIETALRGMQEDGTLTRYYYSAAGPLMKTILSPGD